MPSLVLSLQKIRRSFDLLPTQIGCISILLWDPAPFRASCHYSCENAPAVSVKQDYVKPPSDNRDRRCMQRSRSNVKRGKTTDLANDPTQQKEIQLAQDKKHCRQYVIPNGLDLLQDPQNDVEHQSKVQYRSDRRPDVCENKQGDIVESFWGI